MLTKIGRFDIVRRIGEGAMGVVYEGYDPIIQRRVAIKTIRTDSGAHPYQPEVLTRRFLRETQLAGSINHPNIVTVHDANEDGATAYIVMEYVDGGTLRDFMKSHSRLSLGYAVRLMLGVCAGLEAAHTQGIVHRDIKPSNILLSEGITPKVSDFGIARAGGHTTITSKDDLVGSPAYMSPEQLQSSEVDARSDQYSAALLLYELLSGEVPFNGRSVASVLYKVLHLEPRPLRYWDAAVPRGISEATQRALSKNPSDRYRSVAEFAECLRGGLTAAAEETIITTGSAPMQADTTWTGMAPPVPSRSQRHEPAEYVFHRANHTAALLKMQESEPGLDGMEFLEAARVDPVAEDRDGFTLLFYAAFAGDLKGVKRELRRGAGIHHRDRTGRNLVSHLAAVPDSQMLKMMRFLIRRGAKIDEPADNGMTPIMYACQAGNLDAARLLIKRGARLDRRDKLDKDALHHIGIEQRNVRLNTLIRGNLIATKECKE